MKHIIFRLLFTSIIVIVMIETSAVNALFMLFVAGAVPGTKYVVPADTMMLFYCTVICALIIHLTARDFLRTRLTNYLVTTRDSRKNTTPQATL